MKYLLAAIFSISIIKVSAQQRSSTLPSKAQLNWANAEVGVLIHFDMPVFEPEYNFRANWDYHPDLSIFNPKELDTDQWIKAAKAAGATGGQALQRF